MAESSSWQQLSAELGAVMDNFNSMIKASQIPDEEAAGALAGGQAGHSSAKVPSDLLEVWAEKLLFSAYMCLHHISELKKSAALSDFGTQIANARAVKTAMSQADDAISQKLAGVKAEAQALLNQLEDSYYSSRHKGHPTEINISEELRELCQLALEAPNPAHQPR